MLSRQRPSPLVRATLAFLGAAVLAGLLTEALVGKLAFRWEAARQREAIAAQLEPLAASASAACSVQDRALAGQIVSRLVATPDIQGAVLRSNTTELARAGRAVPAPGAPWLSRAVPSPFFKEVQAGELSLAPDLGEAAHRAAHTAAMLRMGTLGLTFILALAFAALLRRALQRPRPSLSDRMHQLKAESGALLASPLGQTPDDLGQLVWDLDTVLENMTSFRNAIRAAQLRTTRNRPTMDGDRTHARNLSLRFPS
jgi:hypothetical protein